MKLTLRGTFASPSGLQRAAAWIDGDRRGTWTPLSSCCSHPGRWRAAEAAGHSWKHGTQDSGERAASGRGAHRLASSLRIGEGGQGDAGDFWTSVREGSLT